MSRAEILGVRVDRVGRAEALEAIDALVERGAGAQVVTANAELVMAAQRDLVLRAIVNGAALVVPDGIGVVWAAARLGSAVPERVPGIELAEAVLARAAQRGWPAYLLGGRPGVAEDAAQKLRARVPGVVIAGTQDGYFRGRDDAVVQAVRASGARIVLVGIGAPAQERWIAARLPDLGIVAMGVGGSLDVWAERTRRAPALLRRLHLEWMWRLVRDPRRLRRQLALPGFVVRVLLVARQGKGG